MVEFLTNISYPCIRTMYEAYLNAKYSMKCLIEDLIGYVQINIIVYFFFILEEPRQIVHSNVYFEITSKFANNTFSFQYMLMSKRINIISLIKKIAF